MLVKRKLFAQGRACDMEILESQDHLSICEGYSDLRLGRDLSNDKDLVEFYRLVMERREESGWG